MSNWPRPTHVGYPPVPIDQASSKTAVEGIVEASGTDSNLVRTKSGELVLTDKKNERRS